MYEEKEIQLKFDPGRGEVPLRTITAVKGDRVGAMPRATRRGYVFAGWYTVPQIEKQASNPATRVTSERIVDDSFSDGAILYAHWTRPIKEKGQSSLASQRRALIAMAIAAVVLIVGLVIVNIIVDIYHFEDLDGTVYTIKKKDGEYALFHADGALCTPGQDGSTEFYNTSLGTQVIVDPETAECEIYAVVDTAGSEVVGNSRRVLMFKQLTYDKSSTTDMSVVLKRIEVNNEYGKMVFERFKDGETYTNTFVIEGHEATAYNTELFAQLSVGCGYTISQRRLESPVLLEDGSVDLSEYGLVPETRTRTDEEGNEETYDYVPVHYTLTTMTGDTYSVTLGDKTVTEGGYYAMKDGWDTIYILSSVNIEAAVVQPIEALVTPSIIEPMTLNSYFDVANFVYRTNIDYTRINKAYILATTGYDTDTLIKEGMTDAEMDAVTRLVGEAQQLVFDLTHRLAVEQLLGIDPDTFGAPAVDESAYTPEVMAQARSVANDIVQAICVSMASELGNLSEKDAVAILTPEDEREKPLDDKQQKSADALKEKLDALDATSFAALYETHYETYYSNLHDSLLKQNSKLVTSFSYKNMEERELTLQATVPYEMTSTYMAGYLPNSNNISEMLQKLYSMTFLETVSLGPTEEEMAAYGLDEPAHVISFIYHKPVTVDDVTTYTDMYNLVYFSEKTDEGIYYAYSPYYDMIVAIDESQVTYLEWEEIDWYEREYFQNNIAHVFEMTVESPQMETAIHITADNSASDQSENINASDIKVWLNGASLDYSMTLTSISGKKEQKTGIDNYRRFFQSILTASMEGVADLTEEEMAAFRTTPDDECQLKLTILMDDGKRNEDGSDKGHVRYIVYRFYQYTERKSYMTVEVLNSPDEAHDPTRAQGTFYVLRSFCDKIIADAERLMNGEEITVYTKN